MVQVWLWIGVFSMTLGSIFFGIGAYKGYTLLDIASKVGFGF